MLDPQYLQGFSSILLLRTASHHLRRAASYVLLHSTVVYRDAEAWGQYSLLLERFGKRTVDTTLAEPSAAAGGGRCQRAMCRCRVSIITAVVGLP